MINLSAEARESDFGRLFRVIETIAGIPNQYYASSISDFIEHRTEISPARSWYSYPDAEIELVNVGLEFITGSDNYRIHDLSGEMIVGPSRFDLRQPPHSSVYRKNLSEGRYTRLQINYDLKKDDVWLRRAEKFGPPQKDSSEEPSLDGFLKQSLVRT